MRRVVFILAAVLPLAFAGCGDSTGPGRSLAGAYMLRTFNGQTLPATTAMFETYRQELTGGSVRLNDDGTFSASHTSRTTQSGSVTTSTYDISGTYTRNGNALTLSFPEPDGVGGVVVSGSWDGNRRLTVISYAQTYLYEK